MTPELSRELGYVVGATRRRVPFEQRERIYNAATQVNTYAELPFDIRELLDLMRAEIPQVVDVTAAAEVHTGAMVALVPTDEDAERLAVDGGEDAEQLHMTLGYLGEAALIPEEVQDALVECVSRCVLDRPTIVGNAFALAAINPETGLTAAYDPNQVRDWHGRWTDEADGGMPDVRTPGDVAVAEHGEARIGQAALDSVPARLTPDPRGHGGQYDDAVLDGPEGIGSAAALSAYEGVEYQGINNLLRGNYRSDTPAEYVQEQQDRYGSTIADIDQTLAASPLESDVTVERAISNGRSVFGDAWYGDVINWDSDDLDEQDRQIEEWEDGKRPDLTGLQWHERGFVSTTADPKIAHDHYAKRWVRTNSALDGEPIVLSIRVPRGTGAVQLSQLGQEAEILLERDLIIEVVGDNGIDGNGVRRLDAIAYRPGNALTAATDRPSRTTTERDVPTDPRARAADRITGSYPVDATFGTTLDELVAGAGGPEPCVALLLSGSQLPGFHEYVMRDVARTFAAAGMEMHQQHKPWVAHVTLVYTPDADLAYFTDRIGPVTFDRVRLAFGDEVYDIPLGDSGELIAAGDHWREQNRAPGGTREGGQWIDGSPDGVPDVGDVDTSVSFTDRIANAATGRAALVAAPVGLPGKPKPSEKATLGGVSTGNVMAGLHDYNDPEGFKRINGGLRRAEGDLDSVQGDPRNFAQWSTERVRRDIEAIDAGMSESRLTEDVLAYRGLRGDPRVIFGDAWSDDDLTGLTWTDDAYSSTSTSEELSYEHFAEAGGVFMRVLIPRGARAVSIDWKAKEDEILLARGTRFRVVSDRGVAGEMRQLDVEVIDGA